ncbi:hypothetical protein PspCFBP13506_02250 [Pseudomonas sp. CFBP13506]|nr:hypothetical protein PspCFBP13506_02250 [Pseudomonas sp. CFBP13506]
MNPWVTRRPAGLPTDSSLRSASVFDGAPEIKIKSQSQSQSHGNSNSAGAGARASRSQPPMKRSSAGASLGSFRQSFQVVARNCAD